MQDFILDDSDDLAFEFGDLAIGRSDEQHQKHILIANKGEYKQYPELGVSIAEMLNNDTYSAVLIEAKKNLEYDGMKINDISLSEDGKLLIDGEYN